MSHFDWTKFGELVVPGIVVGLIMLAAQFFVELYRENKKMVNAESWKLKKEAFSSAILLVDRHLSSISWVGEAVPSNYIPSGTSPGGIEINTVYAQLMLSATNPEIPKRFIYFFLTGTVNTAGSRGEFISLLRKELFTTESPIKPQDIHWVFK